MSDSIIKIVPDDPFLKISKENLKKAKTFLASNSVCASVATEQHDHPVFVDCGDSLDSITCPRCGAKLGFDWWNKAMSKAWENMFISLDVKLPCCEETVSLNDLKYHFPCAFACCVISVLDPSDGIDDNVMDSVRRIHGSDIRVIKAHI